MNTINQFLQSLQLKMLRSSRQYREQTPSQDICEAVRKAKSILCCLPEDPVLGQLAHQMIEQLHRHHPEWRLTIVGQNNLLFKRLSNPQIEYFAVMEKSVNFYGQPQSTFVKQIKTRRYDMAIDLSIDYNFFNLVLLWKSETLLRMGFFHPHREPFFTFLYRLHQETPPDKAYQGFLKQMESLG
jgi:ADP-heptose:LPS heptosyltransferase